MAVFLGAASDCFDRSSPLIPASAGICAHSAPGARDFGTKRFGSEGYAIEELVAELGTAFLCADLDLTLEPREDHAAYIATWLDILTADNRAIFAAASHAQRAADFINGLIRDRDILGTLAGAPPAWRASLY